jgi:adenylosuccinate lyase
MIPRYARPDAAAIWSPETRYKIWFEIEAHAAQAMADLGTIPQEAAAAIWAKGSVATFDADRIDEIERTTKHDVIAFLTHVAEIVGEEARFLHQGMTSSDVLDTCLAVQLAKSSDLLIEDIDLLLAALKRRRWRRWRSLRGRRPGDRDRGRTRHSVRRALGQKWSARHGCRGCGRASA